MNIETLRSRISGDVVAPEDPNWDEARRVWNLVFDHRPALVAPKAAVRGAVRSVQSALEPWEARHMYLNFSDERRDVRRLFPFDVYRPLAVAKARWDAGELFRSNHPIPPATIVSRRPRRSLVRRAPGRAARPVRAAR